MDTVETLRMEASELARKREESWQRSDTDGFLSQWALGLSSREASMKADLAEAGGMAEFPALFDLEGNEVPAKLINGKYGMCWALLGDNGRFTGFVSAFPKRESTMTKKGYREGKAMRPAKVAMLGDHVSNVYPAVVPA